MRELTLIDTGYLATGLVLCLVLPLLMSFRGPNDAAIRKSCMKIVWAGQALVAFAGVAVLLSARSASYAVVFSVVGYAACIIALLREFRCMQRRAALNFT